ncbi:MAG: hypothetical protein QM594_07195 [Niabella sp.]
MMQSMDLDKMALMPMHENEMKEIDGGGFWYDITYVIIGGYKAFIDGAASFARTNPVYYK